MKKILQVYKYFLLIFFLVSATQTISQTFTGTELLARPTDHSITLNVVSSSPLDAYIEYGTASGVYTNTTSTVSKAADEPIVIVIDGLSANTKYYYRLRYRSGGGSFLARDEHTFRTQRPVGSTFTFDITSDSHVNIQLGNGTTWQQTLSNIANDNPDFHIDLGDTFAMDNVSTAQGARDAYIFQRSSSYFGRVSHSASIFIVPGNHEEQEGWHLDDNGNPVNSQPVWGTNAQKRYFPNPVTDDFYSGNSDTYYALDGDQLREDYYAWTWGDALFVVVDPFWYTMTKPFTGNTGGGETSDAGSGDRWDWTLGDIQYWWLKNTLENSNAAYKFLFMHQPTGGTQDYIRGGAAAGTYCEWGGYNEDGTTWGFTTRRPTWPEPIHQILIDNGVSAVFHGHDHQYAYEMRDGVVYQELPSGGFSGNGFSVYQTGVGYCIKALASPGHLRVTVLPSQATVEYINTTNGTVNYTYTILPTKTTVNTKIFLQGAYSGSSMSTALNSHIPLSQPYNTSPWNYTGTESVASIPSGVVDWILLELRDAPDGTYVSTRAAFIKSDGTIVDTDGSSPVSFTGKTTGNYYIVILHRNHLAVMSANPVALSSSSTLFDFTDNKSKFYGNDAASLSGGKYGMYAGDYSKDGFIDSDDFMGPDNDLFTSGYLNSDTSMDGFVDSDDFMYPDNNLFKGTNVP